MSSESQPPHDTAPLAAQTDKIQMGRVLKLVAPIALVLIGVAVFLGFFDGWNKIEKWSRPALVPAKGQVFYNGEPLADGQITFWSTKYSLAIGALDSQGRFELQTDIDGKFVDGAYVGDYVVTVVKSEKPPGASPPILKTPLIYSTSSTSPLKIRVDPATDKNDFKIELEGEPAPPPAPLSSPPPRQPASSASDPATDPKQDAERATPEGATPDKSESTTPSNVPPSDADQP